MKTSDSVARHARIRRLFEQVSECSVEERSRILERACADDWELRKEVELLLARTAAGDARFKQFEGEILRPALNSLHADPLRMNIWLDFQGEEGPDSSDPLIGKTVSHFEIIERLGRGGMGVVYKARDLNLERTVALKFLPLALNADEDARERFVQEARTASALEHPNIATIHEIDETPDHQWFIAMGYYPGETLKERIERGPMAPATALDIVIQLAEALAQAHLKGIVHRDVKPGNVMIGEKDRVTLLDFGLAELIEKTSQRLGGNFLGTVAYMSPEQVRRESLDGRSDLWSLGVVLFEMLTGVRPFTGEHPSEIISQILHGNPLPSALSDALNSRRARGLRNVIATCLAQDPDARYAAAKALLEQLERIRDRGLRKKVVAGLVGGAVTAVVVTALVLGYRFLVPPPEPSGFIEVVDDPFALGQGTVLEVNPGEQGNERIFRLVAVLPLPEAARIVAGTDQSGPVTLYFKVGWPSIGGAPGEVDISWGLAASAARQSEEGFVYFDYSICGVYRADRIMSVWDGLEFWQTVSDDPLATDTYYELWFVINHPANTYDLHIRGGPEFPETTLAYAGAAYRNTTLETLDHFVLITTTGSTSTVLKGRDPAYFDDLYLFSEGENLDRPGVGWILLDDFEDGNTNGWEVDRTGQ